MPTVPSAVHYKTLPAIGFNRSQASCSTGKIPVAKQMFSPPLLENGIGLGVATRWGRGEESCTAHPAQTEASTACTREALRE